MESDTTIFFNRFTEQKSADRFMMPKERSLQNDDSDNSRISVVLMAGLPASGKSTLARKLVRRFDENDRINKIQESNKKRQKLIHIEYDDLEDNLLLSIATEGTEIDETTDEVGDQRREAWNQARQHAVQQLEGGLQKIIGASSNETSTSVKTDTIILMDDNFHLRGMRKQIHRLLLNYRPIRFGILYLETPLEVCLERNRTRSGRRRIPCEVIEKMSTSFEPPRVFWEVSSTMTIPDVPETNDDAFEEIVKFVQECPEIIDLPNEEIDLEQQASDRAKTRENEVHGLDKRLRSYVGKVAKFDKSLARSANTARKTIMEDFKAGKVDTVDVVDAFLDVLVPTTSSMNEEESTRRSSLREILE